MRSPLCRLLLAWQALALCASAYAAATPLGVAPITARIEAGTDYGAVTVSNRGETPTGIDVEIVRMQWAQGKENYAPTEDFVVTPPSFRLQPGKNRLIRFRFNGRHGESEAVYRLFIRQLPEADNASQVSLVLNIGVPIFVSPIQAAPAIGLSRNATGAELLNTGNVTLTLLHLEGRDCPGTPFRLQTRLFPGQSVALDAGSPSACASAVQTDRGLVPLTAR